MKRACTFVAFMSAQDTGADGQAKDDVVGTGPSDGGNDAGVRRADQSENPDAEVVPEIDIHEDVEGGKENEDDMGVQEANQLEKPDAEDDVAEDDECEE